MEDVEPDWVEGLRGDWMFSLRDSALWSQFVGSLLIGERRAYFQFPGRVRILPDEVIEKKHLSIFLFEWLVAGDWGIWFVVTKETSSMPWGEERRRWKLALPVWIPLTFSKEKIQAQFYISSEPIWVFHLLLLSNSYLCVGKTFFLLNYHFPIQLQQFLISILWQEGEMALYYIFYPISPELKVLFSLERKLDACY